MNCYCPTCGVAQALLRSALLKLGLTPDAVADVMITPAADTGSYPALASVRVRDREVYRIESRPDEVLANSVVEDVAKACRC